MVPFQGALDFFLGFWSCLPQPVRSFVTFVLILVIVVAVVRTVLD